MYADGPTRPRSEQNPTRASEPRQTTNNGSPGAPLVPAGKGVDPETLDTATSHVKNLGASMEFDREARKRLNMDNSGDDVLNTTSTPKAILAITDGNGQDLGDNASPSSSTSSSKRVKLSLIHDTNEISAASREEDRRTQ